MSDGERFGGASLLMAFLAGAAVGAAVALLTAPKSGEETRRQIKDDWVPKAREAVERGIKAARNVLQHEGETGSPRAE